MEELSEFVRQNRLNFMLGVAGSVAGALLIWFSTNAWKHATKYVSDLNAHHDRLVEIDSKNDNVSVYLISYLNSYQVFYGCLFVVIFLMTMMAFSNGYGGNFTLFVGFANSALTFFMFDRYATLIRRVCKRRLSKVWESEV